MTEIFKALQIFFPINYFWLIYSFNTYIYNKNE